MDRVHYGSFYATSTCGTPIYMSPEALRRYERYGKPYDIWSLAAVISFVCNRVHLFHNVQDVFSWPGGKSSLDRRKYSIELRQLVADMLCPEPAARPTAGQVLTETQKGDKMKESYPAMRSVQTPPQQRTRLGASLTAPPPAAPAPAISERRHWRTNFSLGDSTSLGATSSLLGASTSLGARHSPGASHSYEARGFGDTLKAIQAPKTESSLTQVLFGGTRSYSRTSPYAGAGSYVETNSSVGTDSYARASSYVGADSYARINPFSGTRSYLSPYAGANSYVGSNSCVGNDSSVGTCSYAGASSYVGADSFSGTSSYVRTNPYGYMGSTQTYDDDDEDDDDEDNDDDDNDDDNDDDGDNNYAIPMPYANYGNGGCDDDRREERREEEDDDIGYVQHVFSGVCIATQADGGVSRDDGDGSEDDEGDDCYY